MIKLDSVSENQSKDYIEREYVIKKLNAIGGCDAAEDWAKGWDEAVNEAIKIVESAPAACTQKGKWIKTDAERTHYCPNCGSKKDGGETNDGRRLEKS